MALELEIDVDRFRKNLEQAKQGLQGVGVQAEQAQKKVAVAGEQMARAFDARGAGLSIAGSAATAATSIAGLGREFSALGSSRALLDIGRVASEFTLLAQATGRTTGVFGTFAGVLGKLTPALAIGSTIVSVASAMGLFSSSTDEATKAVQRQTSALDALLSKSREFDVRAGYGQTDPRLTPGGTIDALTQLRLSERSTPFNIREAAGLFGADEAELRRALGLSGLGERAFELRRAALPGTGRFPGDLNYALGEVSRGQLISAGEFLLRERRQPAFGSGPSPFAGEPWYGTGDLLRIGAPEFGPAFRGDGGIGVRQSAAAREAIDSDIEQAQQAMDELLQKGREFGATIGDAFFGLVSGATSARQALAGLLAEFARTASRQAFSSLFGSAFGGFGTTPGQSQSFTPMDP